MIKIIVRGAHDTGRTTVASFIRLYLEENGYTRVTVRDTAPLPVEQKPDFQERFRRNRERPVEISVELEDGAVSLTAGEKKIARDYLMDYLGAGPSTATNAQLDALIKKLS